MMLTGTTSYGQVVSCFKSSNGVHSTSNLSLNYNSTFSHKITSTGHLALTSYENGSYTLKGDTVIFNVTDFGIAENKLEPQTLSLTRKGVLRGKLLILLDAKGEPYEKLRKTGCQQKP